MRIVLVVIGEYRTKMFCPPAQHVGRSSEKRRRHTNINSLDPGDGPTVVGAWARWHLRALRAKEGRKDALQITNIKNMQRLRRVELVGVRMVS